MKKLFCLFLIVCLIPVFAIAETDLSSMSYDELVELSQQITKEIMSRPEWKQVEVPTGKWIVGTDIPEGFYSIQLIGTNGNFSCFDENGNYVYYYILHDDNTYIGKVELKSGWVVSLTENIYLMPPAILGF